MLFEAELVSCYPKQMNWEGSLNIKVLISVSNKEKKNKEGVRKEQELTTEINF